jgi:hypothetical protein
MEYKLSGRSLASNFKISMMKRSLVFLIILGIYTASAAQETKKIRELKFLAGEWDIEVEARLSMQGEWESSTAKSVTTYTLDSSLIEEEYTGTRQGKPFLSKTFFAVNNMTNKFQRIFIDAPHGVLVDFEGVQTGDSLVFDKNWQYANGTTVKLRVVYKILSYDDIIVESMRMPPNSSAWDVNGKMKYHRKR